MSKNQATKDFLNGIPAAVETVTPVGESAEKPNGLVSQRRVVRIYDRLVAGQRLKKENLMAEFKVGARTVERDIKVIQDILEDKIVDGEQERNVIYDKRNKDYRIEPPMRNILQKSEAFTLLKMLMECRGLNKDEMKLLKDKVIECCIAQDDKREFNSIINREFDGYKGPQHSKDLIERVWLLQQSIVNKKIVKVNYVRNDGEARVRHLIPVGIVYDEFYFYLVAYIKRQEAPTLETSEDFPTIYRIDRIQEFNETKEHFSNKDVPYEKQCTEQEFRQRVPFMFGGDLRRVTFTISNLGVEAALDKIPSAVVVKKNADNTTVIEAKTYGTGIEMWLKSQGDSIKEVKFAKALGKL